MQEKGIRDIIIIGGGPAGLTAGMYVARSRMDAVLLESISIMGQATMTDLIENYPGVEKTNGFDLVAVFKKQAEAFGLEIAQSTVNSVSVSGVGKKRFFTVDSEEGVYKAFSLIIASGASSKKLGVAGENEFIGKGVSYCATCDGPFFKGKDVVVVGGGDTAVEEAIYLTRFAKKVTIVHRRDRLRSASILQERAKASDKICLELGSVVEEVKGEGSVDSVSLKKVKTGNITSLDCQGVFIFVGWRPNTRFLQNIVQLSENGSINVDKAMKTSVEGIFACGDCTSKVLNQVVTAAGDGATAAFSSQRYVEELKGVAYGQYL